MLRFVTGDRKAMRMQMGDGRIRVALGQFRAPTREREFQRSPPTPLIQSCSWRNRKFLPPIPPPQDTSQSQVSISSQVFFFSFSFFSRN